MPHSFLSSGILGVLLILSCGSLAAEKRYVPSGSAIAECNMKCPRPVGILELYRKVRGKEAEEPLLELQCYNLQTKSYDERRLHLNPSSGCWTLGGAGKEDSGVYETEYFGSPNKKLSSQEFQVLDPVLVTNITSNSSQLGEDIAVSVHYSGEEIAVSWELEGERLSDRYRLIDDNRTLIIPSVQRGDAERRFRVTVINPVSVVPLEYRLCDDSNFLGMLEEGGGSLRRRWGIIFAFSLLAIFSLLYWFRSKRKGNQNVTSNDDPENGLRLLTLNGSPGPALNGSPGPFRFDSPGQTLNGSPGPFPVWLSRHLPMSTYILAIE